MKILTHSTAAAIFQRPFWSAFYRSKFLLLGISLFSVASFAQQLKLSDKPEEFITDLQIIMATDANPLAVESGKKFESFWTANFSPEQKTKIIAIGRKMLTRGYKMPQFYSFILLFGRAIEKEKFSNEALDNLINVTQKTVDSYDLKTGSKIIETISDFLDKRLLYSSNFNRLYAVGGTYILKFLEKKVEAQAAATTTSKLAEPSHFDEWDTPPIDEWATSEAASNNSSNPLLGNFDKKPMPLLTGTTIELTGVDLVVATSSDSVFLKQTKGVASLKDGLFVGNGGKFAWENVEMPQIFVTVSDYFFELRNPKITAEDVALTYPERLTAPIKGVFEYKGEKRKTGIASTYPRFMSYSGDAFIKNIDASIEYKGGFSLSGRHIYSSSLARHYSTIVVKKNGKSLLKAISSRFELGDSLITASRATFAGYMEKDSISHPSVKFSYNPIDFVVRLNKVEKGGFRETPYADTFHRMEIKSDGMKLDLNTGKVDFYIVSAKDMIPVVFESFDYYNPQRLHQLSEKASFNPLMMANNYTRARNKTSFVADELSQVSHLDPKIMQEGLVTAVQMGFLDYDPTSDSYKISRKGTHYLEVISGKSDYDDFRIASLYTSHDSTSNATLNLQDKSLNIRGIREFKLSDSLKISIIPTDATMTMGKSRVFTVNGQIKLGNFRFTGQNFTVDYDNFTVALNKIDSISFIPQDIYQKGGKKEIGGHLRYPKPGMLYINRPGNKSGKSNSAEYPKLVINDGVMVYFDQPQQTNGPTYDKSVYFEIPKIDSDSLNTKDIEWAGTFHAGNIFPSFKETLRVMPDATLGFTHQVPNDVEKIYGTASSVKFASPLLMDGKGLHTEGNILHLAANLTAKEIYFMQDSLMAKGELGEIKEMATAQKVYFPQVEIQNYTMKWLPKADSMLIASKEGFDFYSKTSKLTGKLIVRSGGLFGIGKLKRTDSEIASEQFKFNKEGFLADLAQLKVQSTVANAKPVLLGNNVNVNFNVAGNLMDIATATTGNFNNTVASNLEFPSADYKTNIDRAEWNIKDKKITMKGDVNTSLFTSTNVQQEGLAFNGSSAIYDIEQMTLNIGGVPYIKSADAKIIPNQGQVAIRRDAEMLPFKNAHLTIDTLNGYHNLANGNIKIVSKSKFTGDATYQFVNVRKDTFNIKMGNFELREALAEAASPKKKEKNLSTYAQATVSEKDSVFLSPKMLYRGDITMLASIKNLSLDGFVRPELRKYPRLGGYWIPYKGNKSEEILITVDKNLKTADDQIVVGLHERSAGTGVYPTFLSPKEAPEDHTIFEATGTLRRDEPNKLFVISAEKEGTNPLAGNRYQLLDEQGIIKLEGNFDLLSGKNSQYMQTSGFATIRLDTPKHEVNAMMVMNFPIPQPILLNMGAKIVKTNLDEGDKEGAIVFDSPEFQSKLAQFIGDKGVEDYKAKAAREHVALFRESPKFAAPIVFSELHLVWSPKHNSFYSVGPLGVSNIGETDINTQMDGYVEIRKNATTGDEVYVYLEASSDVWYYFGYREGEMGIISSEQPFNDLMTTKAEKSGKGKEYAVISVDLAEAKSFRQDFRKVYLGLLPEPPKPKVSKKLAEKPVETETKDEAGKDEKDKKVAETPTDSETKGLPKKDDKETDKKLTADAPKDKDGKDLPKKEDKDKKVAAEASKDKITKDLVKEPVKKEEKKKKTEDTKEGF